MQVFRTSETSGMFNSINLAGFQTNFIRMIIQRPTIVSTMCSLRYMLRGSFGLQLGNELIVHCLPALDGGLRLRQHCSQPRNFG